MFRRTPVLLTPCQAKFISSFTSGRTLRLAWNVYCCYIIIIMLLGLRACVSALFPSPLSGLGGPVPLKSRRHSGNICVRDDRRVFFFFYYYSCSPFLCPVMRVTFLSGIGKNVEYNRVCTIFVCRSWNKL